MVVTVVVNIVYALNAVITDPDYSYYRACMTVVIIFHDHIAWLILWMIACLFVGQQMFLQLTVIDVDTHGPLFVATDAERSDCVHMLLGALQR